jgi:hypothetical protein
MLAFKFMQNPLHSDRSTNANDSAEWRHGPRPGVEPSGKIKSVDDVALLLEDRHGYEEATLPFRTAMFCLFRDSTYEREWAKGMALWPPRRRGRVLLRRAAAGARWQLPMCDAVEDPNGSRTAAGGKVTVTRSCIFH